MTRREAVIEMHIADLTVDPATDLPVVMLQSDDGEAIFPVSVGALEAKAIRAELQRTRLERPLAHDLIKDILGTCGQTVEHIEIARCDRHELTATLHLVDQSGVRKQVNARPSDALAVAVRCGARILVRAELLAASAWLM